MTALKSTLKEAWKADASRPTFLDTAQLSAEKTTGRIKM